MQIVIDIDEEIYKDAKEHMNCEWRSIIAIHNALNNCTVLPKGHGKLVDADKAVNDYANYGISHMWDATDLPYIMDECPTVLEADKEVENDQQGEI